MQAAFQHAVPELQVLYVTGTVSFSADTRDSSIVCTSSTSGSRATGVALSLGFGAGLGIANGVVVTIEIGAGVSRGPTSSHIKGG